MDLKTIVNFLLALAHSWVQAISAPKSQLQAMPGPDLIADALRFYLEMLIASMLFYLPLALGHGSEFGAKVRLAANGLAALLTSALVATVWHFPFHWLGGRANFGGTFLAIVYGNAPYTPIIGIFGVLMLAGLPEHLRHAALSPATSPTAIQAAMKDPDLSKGTYCTGSLLMGVALAVSWIVTLRCMAYVQNVHGFKLVIAVLLSLIFSVPVGLFLQKVGAMLSPFQ